MPGQGLGLVYKQHRESRFLLASCLFPLAQMTGCSACCHPCVIIIYGGEQARNVSVAYIQAKQLRIKHTDCRKKCLQPATVHICQQLCVMGAATQDNPEVFQKTDQTQPPGHTGWGLLQRQANLVLQLLAHYF